MDKNFIHFSVFKHEYIVVRFNCTTTGAVIFFNLTIGLQYMPFCRRFKEFKKRTNIYSYKNVYKHWLIDELHRS
jgi:hypothetical protein